MRSRLPRRPHRPALRRSRSARPPVRSASSTPTAQPRPIKAVVAELASAVGLQGHALGHPVSLASTASPTARAKTFARSSPTSPLSQWRSPSPPGLAKAPLLLPDATWSPRPNRPPRPTALAHCPAPRAILNPYPQAAPQGLSPPPPPSPPPNGKDQGCGRPPRGSSSRSGEGTTRSVVEGRDEPICDCPAGAGLQRLPVNRFTVSGHFYRFKIKLIIRFLRCPLPRFFPPTPPTSRIIPASPSREHGS